MGPWRDTDVITVPADGPVSWTAREDLAEAAAVILASGGAYDGPTTLTASSAPTFSDIAEIASEISGRTIGCVVMDPDRWVAAQIDAGQPEGMAHFTLSLYEAAEGGYFAEVDPLLGMLLGNEPRTVHNFLAQLATS